jgi:hypothetical protein
MPKFDSDKSTSASQLIPSVKELMQGVASSVFNKTPVSFTGVMDGHLDPHCPDRSQREAPPERSS